MAIEERFIVVAWKPGPDMVGRPAAGPSNHSPREKMARHQARQEKTVKERAVLDRKGRAHQGVARRRTRAIVGAPRRAGNTCRDA
ncbi:hypothetical protein EJB05_25352 [Eragrostis curvula]|uniref:Uncharacterized protein n=1 Tax=Eragrostis curvula TaxID=38414 RepID=A0A5J9VBN5_9POAL|nr:hypothetical protein EJB05_25352 [Eragrostis curvula]